MVIHVYRCNLFVSVFQENCDISKQLGFYFLKVLVFVVYSNSYQNHFNESLDFEQYMTNSDLTKVGSTNG